MLLHLLMPLFRLLLSSFSFENATSLAEGGLGESEFYSWCADLNSLLPWEKVSAVWQTDEGGFVKSASKE